VNFFTVAFYDLKLFCSKTAQFCATRCESEMAETPSVRNDAQPGENAQKLFPELQISCLGNLRKWGEQNER
jgi:hypothetical protein